MAKKICFTASLFILLVMAPVYAAIAPELNKTQKIASKNDLIAKVISDIGQCESGNRQFNSDGSVLRGIINHKDIGKYQINLDAWGKQAEALGYDIFTEEGNTYMAMWIYNSKGTSPWKWSKPCWSK